MGSVGVTTQSTREPFNYGEYSMTHTKIETAHEFTRQTGITVDYDVVTRLTKSTLVELCTQVDTLAKQFEKDWGFAPIKRIFSDRSGFMCARDSLGIDRFAMGVNVSQNNANNDFIKEAVAHEFGHFGYAYLMYKTLSTTDAHKALDNRDNSATDPSPRSSYYRSWNTPEAKAIVQDALKGLNKYQEFYNSADAVTLSERKRQQKAINDTLKYYVSKYATASYQEGIAECFAREYTGRGNEASKAVFEHVKKQYKKAKLI